MDQLTFFRKATLTKLRMSPTLIRMLPLPFPICSGYGDGAGRSCGWGQSLCIGGMSQTCIPNTPGENFTTEGPLLLLLLPDLIVKEERQRPSFTHQFVHSFTPSYFIYFLSIYWAFPMSSIVKLLEFGQHFSYPFGPYSLVGRLKAPCGKNQ